ncbi:MAG: tetratricopeptide repeat protein [Thermoplasmata archaeon]
MTEEEGVTISEYLSTVMKSSFGDVLGRSILKKQLNDLDIDLKDASPRDIHKLSNRIYEVTQDMGDENAKATKEKIEKAKRLLEGDVPWKTKVAKGDACTEMSRLQKAKRLYEEALEECGVEEEKGEIYRKIGRLFQRLEDYDKSEDYYDKAIKTSSDPVEITICMEGKSGALWRQGKHKEALQTAKMGMEELKGMTVLSRNDAEKKKMYEAMLCRSMGNIYLDLYEKDKAIEYSKKAIELYKELNKKANAGAVYNNLARVFEDFEEFDTAIKNYDKAVRLCKESGSRFMGGWAMFNYASALCEVGQPDKALEYCDKSRRIMEDFNHRLGRARVDCMEAKAYKVKGLYDKSEEKFQKSLELLKGAQATDYVEITLLEYARMLEDKGETDRAVEKLERAQKIHGDKEQTITSKRVEDFLKELKL